MISLFSSHWSAVYYLLLLSRLIATFCRGRSQRHIGNMTPFKFYNLTPSQFGTAAALTQWSLTTAFQPVLQFEPFYPLTVPFPIIHLIQSFAVFLRSSDITPLTCAILKGIGRLKLWTKCSIIHSLNSHLRSKSLNSQH